MDNIIQIRDLRGGFVVALLGDVNQHYHHNSTFYSSQPFFYYQYALNFKHIYLEFLVILYHDFRNKIEYTIKINVKSFDVMGENTYAMRILSRPKPLHHRRLTGRTSCPRAFHLKNQFLTGLMKHVTTLLMFCLGYP